MITLVPPSRGHITQRFRARQIDGNLHAGQDYAYTNGREIFPEIYAAADGVVLFAGDSRGLSWPNIMYLNPDFNRADSVDESAGNYIIIAHNDGSVRVALTGYGHLEEVWVTAGQTVKAGQQIGVCGATGFSAGKHLHFDLVLAPFDVDDAPLYGRVDPNPYFTGSVSYASGDINPQTSEEYEVITEEDIQKIAKATRDLIMFDNKGGNTLGELISEERDHHRQVIAEIGNVMTNPMIHPVQAEGIVSSTVERIAAKLDGRIIDAGQADDIARAAARYNQEQDAEKEEAK